MPVKVHITAATPNGPKTDVTKYRIARTAYTARTALRVDLHGE